MLLIVGLSKTILEGLPGAPLAVRSVSAVDLSLI